MHYNHFKFITKKLHLSAPLQQLHHPTHIIVTIVLREKPPKPTHMGVSKGEGVPGKGLNLAHTSSF